MIRLLARLLIVPPLAGGVAVAADADAARGPRSVPPAPGRFATDEAAAAEAPDFQRHVLPLMGRVGCNTRSCHGSFQGAGGLRLSLFGYDFQADRATLTKADSGRVVLDDPEASKILAKPTLMEPHKGGRRLEAGTWQYRLLARWIEAGAPGVRADAPRFDRLEVTPSEIRFGADGEAAPLRVVAHWQDGTAEDVTALARFRSNDEAVAEVDEAGTVRSTGRGDSHVIAFYDNGVAAVPVLRAVSDQAGDRYPADVAAPTKIDELVVAKLRKLGIVPSGTCTDAEFLRRASLDLTGSLPAPAEVEAFLSDPAADKRARKVDELLERPTYAAWWTTKLCDYTGAAPQTLNAQQWGPSAPRQWYDWIQKRVAANIPYDQIAAGLIQGTSRAPGQSYEDFLKGQARLNKETPEGSFADLPTMPHYWARNNFRKPEERVIGLSYAFLGVRLECAQCHKHPFDQWTQADFNRFGDFFRTVAVGNAPDSRPIIKKLNEELGLDKLMGNERNKRIADLRKEGKELPWQEVFVNRGSKPVRVANAKKAGNPDNGRVPSAKILGGDEVELADLDDPRLAIVEWLRGADNPYFARAFVNRVWASHFGVGIVNPPDDMNLANPPSNAPLLDHLAAGFVAHGFDMKWLHREILASQAYQRSWRTDPTNEGDRRNFSHALIRRLPAEVLIDGIEAATANGPSLAALATATEGRAIGPRVAGGRNRSASSYAGRVFGASTRETNCDCNRSDDPNLLQSIYLQNDNEVFAAIDRAEGWLAERAKLAREQAQGRKAKEAKGDADDDAAAGAAEVEKRLKGAREAGNAKRIEKLEARLAALRERKPGSPPASAVGPEDRAAIVREAYLRALGRPPLPAEFAAADGHLAGAADLPRGMRDLLWALLNTKEFATNH